MQMKSIVADIRLPSQNIKIQHAQSQPKSIKRKAQYTNLEDEENEK